jgi:methionine-S-sulfoxide reductase
LEGVIRTRVGYSGGTKHSPTYCSLGDHTETVQIDYAPARITYEQLLNVFWESHDPSDRSWSKQYRNAIFYHNDEQKKSAEKTRDFVAAQLGRRVHTDIEPASTFYPAEDYHQKFRLQQDPVLTAEYDAIYPEMKDFVNSPAVSRVNGYLGGYGSSAQLKKEINSLGLSPSGMKRLLESAPLRNRQASFLLFQKTHDLGFNRQMVDGDIWHVPVTGYCKGVNEFQALPA